MSVYTCVCMHARVLNLCVHACVCVRRLRLCIHVCACACSHTKANLTSTLTSAERQSAERFGGAASASISSGFRLTGQPLAFCSLNFPLRRPLMSLISWHGLPVSSHLSRFSAVGRSAEAFASPGCYALFFAHLGLSVDVSSMNSAPPSSASAIDIIWIPGRSLVPCKLSANIVSGCRPDVEHDNLIHRKVDQLTRPLYIQQIPRLQDRISD